jgi:hypothetical protein
LSKRHSLTISDYAVVALCPSLIVLLLSSLVYFVILCVYKGEYSSRLGYIWFMFILGTVNIARLSIEQSRSYATAYAAVLGIATFFVLGRFQTFAGGAAGVAPIVNLFLIAGVWFLADRITYDCTLIDDDEDASGQGLLDGLSTREGIVDVDQSPGEPNRPVASSGNSGDMAGESKPRRKKKRHQPGRTVLWLTAAALPVFGAGQVFLQNNPSLQQSALMALAIYMFATLSLLVATSFLGVRRYLRQRGVEMPGNVSRAWLGGGIVTTAIILALCFALPQPGKMLANLELPTSFESPDWLKPSNYGWGSEGAKGDQPGEANTPASPSADGESAESEPETSGAANEQGEGGEAGERGGGEQPGGQKPSGEQSGGEQSGKQKSDGQQQNDSRSDKENGEQRQESQAEGQKQTDSPDQKNDSQNSEPSESSPAEQSSQQPQQASNWMPSLAGILKGIIYLVLLAIIAAFIWFNRAVVAELWRRISDWLTGRQAGTTTSMINQMESLEPTKPSRPFASFTDPLARSVDPRRAVIETFQATEAWYREQGQPRRGDETPQEYANRLSKSGTVDPAALNRLIEAYNRVVYGGGPADQDDLKSVKIIWQSFRRSG